jgi:hypothetical protein
LFALKLAFIFGFLLAALTASAKVPQATLHITPGAHQLVRQAAQSEHALTRLCDQQHYRQRHPLRHYDTITTRYNANGDITNLV